MLVVASAAGARERSMFTSQQLGAVGTSWFSIDLDTGALTQNPGVTNTGLPTVPNITPDGKFFYVGDYTNAEINGFSVGSGGLTALAGFPVSTGTGPNAVVSDPTSSNLWSANFDASNVSGFSIGGSGGLSAITGFPVPSSGGLTTLGVSPRNQFVYAPGSSGDTIAGYLRNPAGELTPLAGFPVANTGAPYDVEFSVDGTLLFVANNTADSISVYSINQTTGALTEVAGSPFTTAADPVALAATTDGRFLLCVASSGTIDSLAIASDGSLTSVDQDPAGFSPWDIEVTPDDRFAYVANYWTGTITGLAIAADGTLDELSGSPFGDGSGAIASFAIVPDQGPTAAFSSGTTGLTASFNGGSSSDPDGSVATYSWNFGDGATATTSSATTSHAYAAPGTYNVTLQVTDDENCSAEQVGTGQVFSCNGSSAAITQHTVTVSATPVKPLTLTHASGKQVKSRKQGNKITRRVRVSFGLSLSANVTYQFQKSTKKTICRRPKTVKKGKASFKNFGRKMTKPGTAGPNQRTFTNKLGGKKIVPGRYRVKLLAKSSDGRQTKWVTTASFCVR